MSLWGQLAKVAIGAYSQNRQRKAQEEASNEAKRQADLAYKRSLPWDVQGLFGSTNFDEDSRKLSMELSAPWQQEYDTAFAGADKQRRYIADMEADPMAAGKKFYEMQKALYAPEQEADRLALENRLLDQGMLGSSGGASRIEALRKAQAGQDLQAQYDGLSKAQGMIDTYRGRSAADLGMAESIANLTNQYAQTGQGIGTGMSNIADTAGRLGSWAAQAKGASDAAYYNNLGNQFKKIQWGGLFGDKTPARTPTPSYRHASRFNNPYK